MLTASTRSFSVFLLIADLDATFCEDLPYQHEWMPLQGHSEARHHDRGKRCYSGVVDSDGRIGVVWCV
jgi:hypothetical protein